MKKHLVWLLAAPLLAGCDLDLTGFDAPCDYERTWSDQINAARLTNLRVLADAGDLRIEGRSNSSTIRVRARACATDDHTVDDIDFDLRVRGSTAELESFAPSRHRARLDLVIEMPAAMAAEIYHEEGDVDVRNIEYLFIDDRSGHITARDIAFDVDVRDTSGHIKLSSVRGNVTVEDDTSGDIDVNGVSGDFTVLYKTGSGSIRHQNVSGTVRVPR